MLRSCLAVAYDRVIPSDYIGDAEREEGYFEGRFVAIAALPISHRLCFLVRLAGERYAQIYTNCNAPKIFKTKYYCVDEWHDGIGKIDASRAFSTKKTALEYGHEVLKGTEILNDLEHYEITILFS